jgi:hypothetical protein
VGSTRQTNAAPHHCTLQVPTAKKSLLFLPLLEYLILNQYHETDDSLDRPSYWGSGCEPRCLAERSVVAKLPQASIFGLSALLLSQPVTNLAKINPADDYLGGLKEGAMFFSQTVPWDDEQLPSHRPSIGKQILRTVVRFSFVFLIGAGTTLRLLHDQDRN